MQSSPSGKGSLSPLDRSWLSYDKATKTMWKKLAGIAAILFLAVILEVSLIYLNKAKGSLGFKINLKPDFDVF